MRRVATPGEIVRWEDELAALPEDRRRGVIGMLAEVVADCPVCDEPVRRCDRRILVGEHIAHLGCAGAPDTVPISWTTQNRPDPMDAAR